MTVIAIGEDEIAADGLMCFSQERQRTNFKKIIVLNGTIYMLTGKSAIFQHLIEWHRVGAQASDVPPMDKDENWNLMIMDECGLNHYSNRSPYPEPLEVPTAFGCGCEYALGAMKAGASPRRAVEIACELNVFCGGEIQVVNIAEALGLDRKEVAE